MEGHLKSCTYVACEQCTECAPAALPTRYNEAMVRHICNFFKYSIAKAKNVKGKKII